MLFTLIKNELIKITRRSKTWIVFGLFVVLMIVLGFAVKNQDKNARMYNSIEYQIDNTNEEIQHEEEYLEKLKSEPNLSEEEIIETQLNIEELKENLAKQQELLQYKDQPDFWKIKLTKEKEQLEEQNSKDIPNEAIAYNNERINEINTYLENDTEPVDTWEFDGINFGMDIFKAIGLLILSCGIAIFMSDIVSGESTPPTLKFLLVQPVSRSKVILSKFIAVVITVVSMIFSIELIMVGIVGAIGGFGGYNMIETIGTRYEWDYSTVSSTGEATLKAIEGSGYSCTRGMWLLQSFGIEILFIIACCAFIFMVSCIFKSSMTTMALSIIISVATTMVSAQLKSVGSIAHLIFLSYGDATSLIDGNIAYTFNNVNFSVTCGIIVLIVTSIISYAIGNVVFNKKDILI